MSRSNGSTPLSFDLTPGERVQFGFKQGFGKGKIGGNHQNPPSESDRPLDSSISSLSKTRSFSDAFAPELLPPLPSNPFPSKPAFPRSNSEPFPLFPQHLDHISQDSDGDELDRPEIEMEMDEEDKEEEINALRQYTNLLSPSPDRKKQRLHHIASSPPRFDTSPFLTRSTSTSHSFSNNSLFGPFATGSQDFVSTSTAPLAREGAAMGGADRMRSLSIGTGLDLLSLNSLDSHGEGGGGGIHMAHPDPPSIIQSRQDSDGDEEDEEEAIPFHLTTVSPPQGGVQSDLSLLPSPTESYGSSSSIEVPLAQVVEEVNQEEEDSTLSELSQSTSSPSLSPPPIHHRFSFTPPVPSSNPDENEEEDEVEESDQDSPREERAQAVLRELSNLLTVPSNLPPGSLEVLEACISTIVSGGGSELHSLLAKFGLINSSPEQEQIPSPRSSNSNDPSFLPQLRQTRNLNLRPRFLPPKPRSQKFPPSSPPTRANLRAVPRKLHPAYPEPFELGWIYETGLDTFEEKREKRTVLLKKRESLGGRGRVKEESESDEGGFESDDERDCSERRLSVRATGRGKARGKGLKRGQGRGGGRKMRHWEVDSE